MKSLVLVLLLCSVALTATRLVVHADRSQAGSQFAALRNQAEKLYAEKSYSKSREIYLQIRELQLSPADARWVDFRLADTLWRAEAATNVRDSTNFETAQQQLEALARDIRRAEDRDNLWAEVQESLGDFWWMRMQTHNWQQAWHFYENAMDWWAGSPDLSTARDRYLEVVWKVARPSWADQNYGYGYYGNYIPRQLLENALQIAQTDNDRAHLHFLIAMTIRGIGGDWNDRQRVPDEFDAAIKYGKSSDWYDDALFYYADWMASYGRVEYENNQWQQKPDYVKALELYRRFVAEHKKGESRYYDQVVAAIEQISKPHLELYVSTIFVPGSEIQFRLGWRNVKRIDLEFYRVDLTGDLGFDKDQSAGSWMDRVTKGARVKSMLKQIEDKGDFVPGSEDFRVDGKLSTGAYLVEATSETAHARDLILVTDASVVLKTAARQALAYVCDVNTGAPIPQAKVRLWEHAYDGTRYSWHEQTRTAGSDGIARFDFTASQGRDSVFVAASSGDKQAFTLGYNYWYRQDQQHWRVFAFTDRPAYRPGETVQWKFFARRCDNDNYSTPAHEVLEYQITDARGTKVKEGKADLNAFGSAWGSLEVSDQMPLGEYRMDFWTEGRRTIVGGATLFRLEEYKLPEYKVSVRTPEENGRKKIFRLGDKIEATLHADYYFGGPVANASVEVIVYQNPLYRVWYEPRKYEWYYEDIDSQRFYARRGNQVIKRETLKTDAMGQAKVSFDSVRSGMDLEYTIEARVTDSSRREVVGSDVVRVTSQRYYVYPRVKHYLYRPQDKIQVDVKALDANDQPVSVEGRVTVTRDYWYEVWTDPSGREVKGPELETLQRRGQFPPITGTGPSGWKLKFRGYEHEDVLTQTLKTDDKGEAELSFVPPRVGYYRVVWTSSEKGSAPIRGETAVWVASNAITDIGYRYGGVQIIVDKDTFHTGETAPVLLVAPANDRYVLFSIEGDDLYNCQLVHLTGNVKLVELPINQTHVPNVFLHAAMVNDRQFYVDMKQVIVPPVENFLNVEVRPDRAQYEPREEGTFTVTAKDSAGRPVASEVALGLVDESVFYIQRDYAGDPRQFYFGQKRAQIVQTTSTFQQKAYITLVEGKDKQLYDQKLLAQAEAQSVSVGGMGYNAGGGGGVGAGRGAGSGNRQVVNRDMIMPRSEATVDAVTFAGTNESHLAKSTNAPVGYVAGQAGIKEEDAMKRFQQEPAVQVRSDFRTTALWVPDVVTDKNGTATLKVKFPESLTGWTATARALSEGNQFGIASATAQTKQPLIVRLEAPRFFVAGDSVTVSAVINNNTDKPMQVLPSIAADGVTVTGIVIDGKAVKGERASLAVPPSGEARADWLVAVTDPGTAKLKVQARGNKYADAMEKSFPIFEHGIEKFVTKSGKLRGDAAILKLDIPADRKRESTVLSVQVAPSLAVTMLDALPYLVNYPYGCTEQTMSRFLPAAITRKTLRDIGLKPEVVMARVFGGIETSTADATHPNGKRDLRLLDDMIKQGLDRLYGFQHSDGGWGWWKEGESDHFMSAYVVWGLTLARDAGVDIKSDVLKHGVDFLDKEIVEEEANYDMQAWMLHALAVYHHSTRAGSVGSFQAKALDNIWKNRDRLNAYTRALTALAAQHLGDSTRAKTLIQNLENGVKIDTTPDVSVIQEGRQQSNDSVVGTAHWGEDGIYWHWSDGGVEATAFALRALLEIDPENKLVEPVTNWLIRNRRGAQWSNTRDTAIAVLTLNDYLHRSKELMPDVEYDLLVNGHQIASRKLQGEDALAAPSQFAVDSSFIKDGKNEIRITRRSGTTPLYFSATGQYFSLEEPVTAVGNEIFVRRQYYKLVGKPTLLKGYVYDREPLGDGESVASGERVEVVLTIETKNNYEYLLFEDLKPAGLEAVQLRSGAPLYAQELKSGTVERRFGNPVSASSDAGTDGYQQRAVQADLRRSHNEREPSDYTGQAHWVYQELRDRKVALFIDKLKQGVWEIRYDLRAEVPGKFHALPVLGQAMYAPEIRCNGTELRIKVDDVK